MKRRDLMKALSQTANAQGFEMTTDEGANHTKVCIGELTSTVPRHNEINEYTAKAILKHMGAT